METFAPSARDIHRKTAAKIPRDVKTLTGHCRRCRGFSFLLSSEDYEYVCEQADIPRALWDTPIYMKKKIKKPEDWSSWWQYGYGYVLDGLGRYICAACNESQ